MKAKRTKPGRSRTEKRSCRLAISVTEAEKNRISEQASAANLKISEYLYCVVMNRKVKFENPGFKQDLKNLSSISNNLNQIAKAGNKYGFLSRGDQEVLLKMVSEIYKMISEKV